MDLLVSFITLSASRLLYCTPPMSRATSCTWAGIADKDMDIILLTTFQRQQQQHILSIKWCNHLSAASFWQLHDLIIVAGFLVAAFGNLSDSSLVMVLCLTCMNPRFSQIEWNLEMVIWCHQYMHPQNVAKYMTAMAFSFSSSFSWLRKATFPKKSNRKFIGASTG